MTDQRRESAAATERSGDEWMQRIAAALAPFGWTCTDEFWQRYDSDAWVFNLVNAVERLHRLTEDRPPQDQTALHQTLTEIIRKGQRERRRPEVVAHAALNVIADAGYVLVPADSWRCADPSECFDSRCDLDCRRIEQPRRVVPWFSHGVCSAVACYMTLQKFPEEVACDLNCATVEAEWTPVTIGAAS